MIEFRSLTAGYASDRPVLKELSLQARTGELTVLIGVNGCGKSTLLKSAVGLLPRRQGDLLLDGTDVSPLSGNELARRIAYLPQNNRVPDMTVFELVLQGRFPHLGYPRIYRSADHAMARAAMERVGIAAFADRPLSMLSGGARQTAYLAMALAQETDCILLDEPTTHLDVAHAMELMRLLGDLTHNEGKTVLAVLHDLPLAFAYADRIALLDGGTIVACLPPHELFRHPAIQKIFGISLGYSEDEQIYYVKELRAQI